MGSSSESICEPRPVPVTIGQRRDDVSGRVIMILVVLAAPPSNRLVVITANSLCNKSPPSVQAVVVVVLPTATATTDGRVDGIATAGRLVTTLRGWRDVSRGCRSGVAAPTRVGGGISLGVAPLAHTRLSEF